MINFYERLKNIDTSMTAVQIMEELNRQEALWHKREVSNPERATKELAIIKRASDRVKRIAGFIAAIILLATIVIFSKGGFIRFCWERNAEINRIISACLLGSCFAFSSWTAYRFNQAYNLQATQEEIVVLSAVFTGCESDTDERLLTDVYWRKTP